MARSWARRRRAAETIFMALVICRVFFTLRMRRRKSSTFAISPYVSCPARFLCLCPGGCGFLAGCQEVLLVSGDRVLQALAKIVVQRLLRFDTGQHLGRSRIHIGVE